MYDRLVYGRAGFVDNTQSSSTRIRPFGWKTSCCVPRHGTEVLNGITLLQLAQRRLPRTPFRYEVNFDVGIPSTSLSESPSCTKSSGTKPT